MRDLIKFEIFFFLRFLFLLLGLFIGTLGESIEIQFLAIFYVDFNEGFNQI